MQGEDVETSGSQFALELGFCVAAKMAEVLVDGSIDFRACRNKQAERSAPRMQQGGIAFELGLVLTNVLQHVNAQDGVADRARRNIRGSAFEDFMCWEMSA